MAGGVLIGLGPEQAQQPVAARGLIGGAAEEGEEGDPALLGGAPGNRSVRARKVSGPEEAEMKPGNGVPGENDSRTIGPP